MTCTSRVRRATETKTRVRCVGPGHSFSDITETTGILINLLDLVQVERPSEFEAVGGLLPREDALWKSPNANEPRARVICGALIAEVNDALHRAGLALSNLSGVLIRAGHVEEALLAARDAATLMRDAEDPHSLGAVLVNLGTALLDAERAEEAAEVLGGGLVISHIRLCLLGSRRRNDLTGQLTKG